MTQGWLDGLVDGVETRLRSFFENERVRLAALAPESVELTSSIGELTLRGGKRLRPALLYAAYRAAKPDGQLEQVVDACAALELLQTYLLVHDDWMDADATRRGGPAVHAALSSSHGEDHLGASLAILAGDLACAQSWRLFHSQTAASDGATARELLDVVLQMHEEVIVGQQLDLIAIEDVSRMHQLKTGSYTLRGPLTLGAVLGAATPAQREALDRFGHPLGEVFQLRDDLLGIFGDPKSTGKPAGNDLRAGKRTSLVLAIEQSGAKDAYAVVRKVFGRADASHQDISAAIDAIERSGAREEVENRLDKLFTEACRALERADLAPEGTAMLLDLATRIAKRSS